MSETKVKREYKFGCVDEDGFTLITPRGIDGDAHDTLEEAFAEAAGLIRGGTQRVSIVRCYFSPKHEVWVESPKFGSITVDARDSEVAEEDEDDE